MKLCEITAECWAPFKKNKKASSYLCQSWENKTRCISVDSCLFEPYASLDSCQFEEYNQSCLCSVSTKWKSLWEFCAVCFVLLLWQDCCLHSFWIRLFCETSQLQCMDLNSPSDCWNSDIYCRLPVNVMERSFFRHTLGYNWSARATSGNSQLQW